jgi:hypothetical protein
MMHRLSTMGILVVASILGCCAPEDTRDVALLSARNIRSIQMGDSLAEVKHLLGTPVQEVAKPATNESPAGTVLFYRRRGFLALDLAEAKLYISCNSADEVFQVYAKDGDDGVYLLRLWSTGERWEKTSPFEAAFPEPR